MSTVGDGGTQPLETPGAPRMGRGRKDPPQSPGGSSACRHPDLGPPDSRRKVSVSAVLSCPGCGPSSKQPQDTATKHFPLGWHGVRCLAGVPVLRTVLATAMGDPPMAESPPRALCYRLTLSPQWPHFTDEETKARGDETHCRGHTLGVMVGLRFTPGSDHRAGRAPSPMGPRGPSLTEPACPFPALMAP